MVLKLLKIVSFQCLLSITVLYVLIKTYFLNNFGFTTSLNTFNFHLLLTSILLITISQRFIIDFFTKNEKIILISKKKLLALYSIIILLGLMMAAFLCFNIDKPHYIFLFITPILLYFLHAKNLKSKTVLNNFISSFLKPYYVIILWWIDCPITLNAFQWGIYLKLEIIIIYLVVISFTATFIINITVGIMNIQYDIKHKNNTIPAVFGVRKAKKVIFKFGIFLSLVSLILVYYFSNYPYISLSLFVIFFFSPLIFIFKMRSIKKNKDYRFLIKLINFLLLAGTSIIPLTAYLIK